MRDTDWKDGDRTLRGDAVDARVFLSTLPGGGYAVVGRANLSGYSATDGQRAAEDALRSLCRDVLAALDAPRPKCPDCDGVGGFSAHGKPSGTIVRPCLTCDGQRTVAALGADR